METAYRAWVERALEKDGADVSQVRGERPGIPLTAAHEHSVADLTAQLREQRSRTLRLIISLTPEQFERTASQPMFGKLTVMQWLRSYYRHDRMHIASRSDVLRSWRTHMTGATKCGASCSRFIPSIPQGEREGTGRGPRRNGAA
jgi:hypothetical protein